MEFFDCWYRLDKNEKHLIWYSNDEDGVVVNQKSKQILSFVTSEHLHAYAQSNGIVITKSTPVLHRLDLAAEWLAATTDFPIPCGEFLIVWNMLGDVACSLEMKDTFVEFDSSAANTYDKLFWGAKLPSVTPANGNYTPLFSSDELRQMRALFSWGLGVFRDHVFQVPAQ